MKIAVLGTGFGAFHVKKYVNIGLVDEIIVWGRKEEKLNELKEKFQVHTTMNLEEIWNDESITLVDVCVPNALHKEMAVKALEAGKHVFIEMPLAETIEDSKEIIETAKRCNRRVFVDLFLGHEFANSYLASVIRNKRMGKCKALYLKRQTPPWWGNLDKSVIVLNFMHHELAFLAQIFGNAKDIRARGIDVQSKQSVVTAELTYEDCIASVHASSAMPLTGSFSVGYEAIFEKGFIKFYEDGYGDGKCETKLEIFTEEKREEIPLQACDCYEEVCKDVITSLIENKESILDGQYALATIEMVHKINEQL